MTDKVVFRKFKDGQILALFPRIPADLQGYKCESYMHVGQHGAADPSVVSITKPTTPAEYAGLAKELRSIGYRLEIGQKCTYRDFLARQRIARNQRGK